MPRTSTSSISSPAIMRPNRTAPKPLGATTYYNRLAQRVTAALSVPTAAGPLYDVDTRLRPSGAQGPLVVSLDSFATLSARGGLDLGAYGAAPRPAGLWSPSRARRGRSHHRDVLAAPRDPAEAGAGCGEDAATRWPRTSRRKGPLDIKLAPGGLVDLEFAVQVTAACQRPMARDPSIGAAIACLIAAGLLPPKSAEAHGLLGANAGRCCACRRPTANPPPPRHATGRAAPAVSRELGRTACRARRGAAGGRELVGVNSAPLYGSAGDGYMSALATRFPNCRRETGRRGRRGDRPCRPSRARRSSSISIRRTTPPAARARRRISPRLAPEFEQAGRAVLGVSQGRADEAREVHRQI